MTDSAQDSARDSDQDSARDSAGPEEPSPSPDSGPSLASHTAALVALSLALWLCLQVIDSVFQWILNDTVWTIPGASLHARGSATVFGCCSNALFALLFATWLLWLSLRSIRLKSFDRLLYTCNEGILLVTTWAMIFLYMASWTTFANTLAYLDTVTIQFWLLSPVQVLQHASHSNPAALFQAPIISLIGTWLLAKTLPRWAIDRNDSLASMVKPALIAALALVVLTVGLDLSHSKRELRVHYQQLRNDNTGPIAHLTGAVLTEYLLGSEPFGADENLQFQRPKRISYEDYKASIKNPEAIKRPNVLIVILESLRCDQLASFGGERTAMPTVEAIAKQSYRYTDCFTQASHSNYADLCPLSSQYPLRGRGLHIYPPKPEYPRPLIYNILKVALNYRTAIVSSQNENWGQMINYLRSPHLDHFLHSETFKGETYVPSGDPGFATFVKGEKLSGKIDDRFTIKEAIKWIGQDPKSPFCMYLNLQNSHLPYVVPADFEKPFGKDDPPIQITFGSVARPLLYAAKNQYSNSLAYVDFQFSKLVQYLKEQKLWDQTLVVMCGDTGQAFYEHGFLAHGNKLYDEVMRTPLIIRVPGHKGGEDQRPAELIDVPPTILAHLGLPPFPGFQGRDLTGPKALKPRHRFLVAHTARAHQYAVVHEGKKLIFDKTWHQYRLYDLIKDPAEKKDLSLLQPEAVKRLALKLNAWRDAQSDYYFDSKRMQREYPPTLIEPVASKATHKSQ